MATDPAKNDEIWKGVCSREMMTWMSPDTLKKSLMAQGASSVQDVYRVPMPGEPVKIGGMRRRPELNGAVGEIVSGAVDEYGRVTVKIFDSTVHGVGTSKKMKIQPVRLMPMRSSSTPALGMQLAGSMIPDDRSSVRSCSRAGSIVSGAGRSVVSAASRSVASSLRKPPGTPGLEPSGTGTLHLQARGGQPSKFNDAPFTQKVTGDPSMKDRLSEM